MKNEKTLEEVAEEYRRSTLHERPTEKLAFIRGAKWQAKRSFTLEQIDELFFNEKGGYFDDFLDYRLGLTSNQDKNKITFKEWFEQIKKK